MTMNPLPPQAYTKDIMLKAYSWLMGQSNSIKEMATTPDILVSLYLKATRDGDGALDRPSITNFKNELKSLAGLLGELDKAPSIPSTIPMPSIQEGSASIPLAPSTPFLAANPAPASKPNSLSNNAHTQITSAAHPVNALGLDAHSLLMIHEVKEILNLSSDSEALRMLIKVGYSHTKNMLPS